MHVTVRSPSTPKPSIVDSEMNSIRCGRRAGGGRSPVPPVNAKPSKRTVPWFASVRFSISTLCGPAARPAARTWSSASPVTENGVLTTPSMITLNQVGPSE